MTNESSQSEELANAIYLRGLVKRIEDLKNENERLEAHFKLAIENCALLAKMLSDYLKEKE